MTVRVSTSDQKEFEIEKSIAMKSTLLKNMIEDIGEIEQTIPLPNVSAQIFEKVLEWCEQHKNDPVELEEIEDKKPKSSEDISEWDRKFMNLEKEIVFEIIMAANYLNIKALLDLGCKTVANMIKGKSPEQIRDIFGLENDFTPEEEEKIRQENAWADEI